LLGIGDPQRKKYKSLGKLFKFPSKGILGVIMPLPIKDVLDMIADNTRRRGCPVPIPEKDAYGWADGLNIPRGGETVLFTGLLYQLIPYIDSLVKYLEGMEKTSVGALVMKLGKVAGKVIDVTKIAGPPRERVEEQSRIVRNIAMLLMKSGVSFGYLYEDDMYSGVLLHDLGLDDDFKEHANKVYRKLKEKGVKTIITIDPHTTNCMRKVYPEYIDNYDLEVKNYLEVLSEKEIRGKDLKEEVVIHDPCVYARYEGIIEQPRKLLAAAGVKVLEVPDKSRSMTFCCGGPVESLSPSLSKGIAGQRIEQLTSMSKKIVVMCPICYSSFLRVKPDNVEMRDVSEYLAKGFLEG
jgi:Fe-S oxidoreductase